MRSNYLSGFFRLSWWWKGPILGLALLIGLTLIISMRSEPDYFFEDTYRIVTPTVTVAAHTPGNGVN